MVHGSLHRAAHLRHGRREIKLPRQEVETVVEIVFQTASQTFEGPADFVTPTLMVGSPSQQTQEPEQESNNNAEFTSAPVPTVISAPASAEPTNSQLLTAGVRPSATQPTAANATGASSNSSSASSSDGGMSAGGTAGLVIGVLLLVGVACALALFFIKKKQQKKDALQAIDDNEKAGDFSEKGGVYGGAGAIVPAPISPSIRTARTASTAPRLSLRPVTEFDPAFEEKRKSAANALQMASAPTAGGMLSPASGQASPSAWERRGSEKRGNDDPFSDPVNPFGPDATNSNEGAPKSPSSASNTLVEDSTLIAGAAATDVAAAAAAANSSRKPLPYPQDNSSATQEKPQISEKVAPKVEPTPAPVAAAVEDPRASSPTWVEDVPASPGPAPSGPPPMAAAGTPASGPDNVHRVQLDFKPSLDDELEIRAGQLVRMLHEYDDGWGLCIRMDRSQQGVVPRSCLSKLPVKPRQGPPGQGPPGQGQRRGPPPGARGPAGPNGPNSPRPLTPNGRNSPAPMSPARGPNSPGPNQQVRPRANTSQAHPRSMSPGPHGGNQQPPRPQQESRQRSNSAGPVNGRRQSPPGPSPMNPNPQSPERKPVPGMAL